jgi:hypothetical protein
MNPWAIAALVLGAAVLFRRPAARTAPPTTTLNTGVKPQGITQSKPSKSKGLSLDDFLDAGKSLYDILGKPDGSGYGDGSGIKTKKPGATGYGKKKQKTGPLYPKAQSCVKGTSWDPASGTCIADSWI